MTCVGVSLRNKNDSLKLLAFIQLLLFSSLGLGKTERNNSKILNKGTFYEAK
ncbi:hypothetical protein H8356DRAFT_1327136 [Neocallimastix lanati (nom. inval.)]|nr:hypothetical protein H8356DRAFT_1327136 [Neocallimastix sp. JGI-2020a]